ncbi:MAG TPA: alcohol dehydrogenase catalytic domain-containing protein [Casimicrobiaceae bacterium]|nr:alcohol dehydrogenase catalytic domain-containing protein [Casimicrobiaceae bacterium]
MRAIVQRATGGVEVLGMEDVARPAVGALGVLIRIGACGVCFHDIVVRNGTMRAGVRMPLIPGHEIAGIVDEVGAHVTYVRPGDRVAATPRYHVCGHCRHCRSGIEPLCDARKFLGDQGMVGGYAEYVAVDESCVVRIPDGVADAHAAIAACAIGTALNAVRDVGRVTIGDRVLVTGAGGGVGVHAVQLARLAGAQVIAQTTSPGKAGLLESLGAHATLVTARGEDFSGRVRDITSGDGVDVVVDCVGTVAFDAMRRSLAGGGRWTLVGQLTGDFVRFNPAQLFLRGQSMLSVHSATRRQLADCLALLARGDVKAVVSATHPLADIRRAHERVERGDATGRIVVVP